MRKLFLVALVACSTAGSMVTVSPAPAAPRPAGIRIVNLNLLHGQFCDDHKFCDGADRVKLLGRQLEAAKCPEIVGLQEIN